ncbi:MAG: hypothetical protein E7256_08770 [Lachnospiraceae bacterium]|nr:hypothetical protein [Lachnospiraceae bacterium]
MLERLKNIPARILEIWKKYSKKQKTIFLSIVGVIAVMILVLSFVLSRTEYVDLMTFEDTKTAKEAIDLLKEQGIAYQLSEDNLTVKVDARKQSDAVLTLADSEIASTTKFSLEQLLNNDMSTTNSDKQLKLHLYFQSDLENLLKRQEGIDDARVSYLPTDNTSSILESEKDTSCSVYLTINDKFKKSSSEAIAVAVANALGNSSTENVKIIDQYGNLLYNGPEDVESDYSNKNLEYKKEVTNWYYEQVVRFGLMNGYDYVEPMFNLDITLDKESVVYKEYLAADGLEQGLYQTYQKISSDNTSASGDIPGTDSNNETDYYIEDSASGNSSYEEVNATYLPSERITDTVKEWGVIDNANSSVAITLKKVKTQTEEELELLGLLEEVTYEEYVVNNSEPKQLDVEEELYTLFAKATGIAESNISIVIWEVPNFVPKEVAERNWDFYLKLILAALIIGLLVFVVFRSMAPVEVTEIEPELSVEQLLATTKENQSLDDIEFSEKSETRRMIEKFVDENPEAVANLLRNWLNDEWG